MFAQQYCDGYEAIGRPRFPTAEDRAVLFHDEALMTIPCAA